MSNNVIYVNFTGPFRGRVIETVGEEVKQTSAVARSVVLESHIDRMRQVSKWVKPYWMPDAFDKL